MSVTNPFKDLESNDMKLVDEFKSRLKEQFNGTREPWLLYGIYDYYLINDSPRAIDVIVAIKEPHDKYFFDKSYEGVKSNNKLPHLTLLGYVVRKRPIWLFGISSHPLFKELLRLLKTETDIVTLVSALLIVNILLPVIPAFLVPHLQEMFAAFSKLAAVNANSNNYHEAQLVHLQISLYTLFHRLYGMFPCNFLTYLRETYSLSQDPVFSHTVKPMLDTVRVNPLLISATDSWEVQSDRWKNVEPHDIIISCAKLLMNGSPPTEPNTSIYEPKSSFSFKDMLGSLKVTGKETVADYCNELSKKSGDATLWSPSARYFHSEQHIESTPTRISLTPITRAFVVSSPFSEHEGSSPPEAAVEATPETTPIRVPIIDRSSPSSPIKKENLSFRYSAPEIVPNMHSFRSTTLRMVNQMINDRHQIKSDGGHIEVKSIDHSTCQNDVECSGSCQMISDEKITLLPYGEYANIDDAKMSCITTRSVKESIEETSIDFSRDCDESRMHVASVTDFEACELENHGSPCSSGGLHMPDNRSLQNFVKAISRIRHHSQCHSESGNFSAGTSPQDIPSHFNDAKVRRTNSCPEMKKNSPSSIFAVTALNQPSKQTVPEENDEDGDENIAFACTDEATKDDIPSKSAANSKTTRETICSSSQTEDIQPFHFPYEHLFLDVFPPLHPSPSGEHISSSESENSLEEKTYSIYEKAYSPSNILRKYIDAAIQCHTDKSSSKSFCPPYDARFLANQLKLVSIQLQFEEHRREIHAERNRRLLGRSRRNKTLEEYNNALKEQLVLLQQESEESSAELRKMVEQNELQIQREQNTALYWRDKFVELQEEHKNICQKFQDIEGQLRDERKTNVNNTKLIHESKASLTDLTNELKTCHKEARAARELRATVAHCQAEILKAGETIIRLRRKLTDYAKADCGEAQSELTNATCSEELKKMKTELNMQYTALYANKMLITDLKKELKHKENIIEDMRSLSTAACAKQEKELKELREKYEQLKKLHLNAVEQSKGIKYQLDRAKCVSKFGARAENKAIVDTEHRRSTKRNPIESNLNKNGDNAIDNGKNWSQERTSHFSSHGNASKETDADRSFDNRNFEANPSSSVSHETVCSNQSISLLGNATVNSDSVESSFSNIVDTECADKQLKLMTLRSDHEITNSKRPAQ